MYEILEYIGTVNMYIINLDYINCISYRTERPENPLPILRQYLCGAWICHFYRYVSIID